MTATILDARTALVVDLQKGLVTLPTVHPIAGVLASASTLAAAFRRRRLPVVLVNVTGVRPAGPSRAAATETGPRPGAVWCPTVGSAPCRARV